MSILEKFTVENARAKGLSLEVFTKQNVTDVWMHSMIGLFSKKREYRGTLKFETGSLSGEKCFEGKDFLDLAKQMQDFINTL